MTDTVNDPNDGTDKEPPVQKQAGTGRQRPSPNCATPCILNKVVEFCTVSLDHVDYVIGLAVAWQAMRWTHRGPHVSSHIRPQFMNTIS